MSAWPPTPDEREDTRRLWLAGQIVKCDGLQQLRHRWELAHRMDAPRPRLPRDLKTASRWWAEMDALTERSASDDELRRALLARAWELGYGGRKRGRK